MTVDELIEQLAAIEHERWADWQRWLHSRCGDPRATGGLEICKTDVLRWERQIATPYADLSEHEKQSDRDQVARYWPLIVEFFAGWIESQRPVYESWGETADLADRLRSEMPL